LRLRDVADDKSIRARLSANHLAPID
jgi:hypothetical protein